jgi:hypothetical protein
MHISLSQSRSLPTSDCLQEILPFSDLRCTAFPAVSSASSDRQQFRSESRLVEPAQRRSVPFSLLSSPDLFCILCAKRDRVLARDKACSDIPDKRTVRVGDDCEEKVGASGVSRRELAFPGGI